MMNGSRHESVGFFHKRTLFSGSLSALAPGTAALCVLVSGESLEVSPRSQIAGIAGLPVPGAESTLTLGSVPTHCI